MRIILSPLAVLRIFLFSLDYRNGWENLLRDIIKSANASGTFLSLKILD